jgi:hypothetical protein
MSNMPAPYLSLQPTLAAASQQRRYLRLHDDISDNHVLVDLNDIEAAHRSLDASRKVSR